MTFPIWAETSPSEDIYYCRTCGQEDHADELNDQFWCQHCSSQDLITHGQHRHELDRAEDLRLQAEDAFYARKADTTPAEQYALPAGALLRRQA